MHVLSEGALSATMPFVKIILTVDHVPGRKKTYPHTVLIRARIYRRVSASKVYHTSLLFFSLFKKLRRIFAFENNYSSSNNAISTETPDFYFNLSTTVVG